MHLAYVSLVIQKLLEYLLWWIDYTNYVNEITDADVIKIDERKINS